MLRRASGLQRPQSLVCLYRLHMQGIDHLAIFNLRQRMLASTFAFRALLLALPHGGTNWALQHLLHS